MVRSTPLPGSTTFTVWVVESATARRPSGNADTKSPASNALIGAPVISGSPRPRWFRLFGSLRSEGIPHLVYGRNLGLV